MSFIDTIDLPPVDGFTFRAGVLADINHGAPWEECDGHGPVRQLARNRYHNERSDKLPGELCLGEHWAYDFAEACRIARRDGWGWLPAPVTIDRDVPSIGDGSACGGRATCGEYTAYDADNFNKAIADVYRQHRQSMTPRAYAAEAARRDYQRLQDWCNDVWYYVGIEVTCYRNGIELASVSVWGIESDAGDYLTETARDLQSEAMAEAQVQLDELCDCAEAA